MQWYEVHNMKLCAHDIYLCICVVYRVSVLCSPKSLLFVYFIMIYQLRVLHSIKGNNYCD